MKTPIAGLADFAALDPFFRIIEEVVATGAPYGNRYISVITLRDREIVHCGTTSTRWPSSTHSAGRPGKG